MGKMKGNEFIVKTIVTTELIKKVADKNHIKMLDCYTGFKWIAREIRLREGQEQYIGGGEESYGFLAEDFVRDKDAVSACSLLAEICAWAKDQGKTLYDVLMEIYVEYGFSLEVTVNVVKPGKTGADEIKAMMDNFRDMLAERIRWFGSGTGERLQDVEGYRQYWKSYRPGYAGNIKMYFSSLQPTVQKFLYVLPEQNLRLSSTWKSRAKCTVRSVMQVP